MAEPVKASPPTTFLLGCVKCASTSLFDMLLEREPRLCNGAALDAEPEFFNKEKHFFDYHADIESAMAGFPDYTEHFSSCPPESLAIDGTPNYFCDSHVPSIMHDVYANNGFDAAKIRFIAILRDPVDRAISHFHHNQRMHSDYTMTWEQVVDSGLEKVSHWKDNTTYEGLSLFKPQRVDRMCTLLGGGAYDLHLKEWFSHFEPSQFLILTMPQLLKSPKAITDAILEHVGLPVNQNVTAMEVPKSNSGGGYKRMENAEKLEAFYQPHKQGLFDLKAAHPEAFYETPDNMFRL